MSTERDIQEAQARLDAVRKHRTRKDRDLSLSFLTDQFKRDIERPHKQLAKFVEPWEHLVPADLRDHCRLEAYQRGVLHVKVEGSANVYELRRLLAEGLQDALAAEVNVLLRQVKVVSGVVHGSRG